MTTGGDAAVMATYFHVALSRPARTWLMNLALGSIYSWEEPCARFTANFVSAYQQHGMEAHLHAVRQEPRETLRAYISPSRATRETPFFLVYVAEACLPPKFIMGSPRVKAFDESMQE
jgi:hypothetical protein